MKQFKEGDEAYIKCKILSIYEEDKSPITVEFSTNIDITFKTDGRYIDKDTIPCLFHLSDIQQSQFNDEELHEIKETLKESNKGFILQSKHDLKNTIINKCNLMIKNYEEKEFLEMANKLGYKVNKI